MEVREEARRLNELFANRPADMILYLGTQIATVKTYAQILLGLCGLTVTVTGFSGAHMIRAGSASASLMIGGIALVVVGMVLCIRTITKLRWVSQELRDDLIETVSVVIQHRNGQQRMLSVAALFVAGGLTCYLGAVTVAALAADANLIP